MIVAHVSLSLAACGGSGLSCTCYPGLPLASRAVVAPSVDHSAAVFEGTVVRMVYREVLRGTWSDRGYVRDAVRVSERQVTFVVGRRWKGALADTVIVHTAASTAACGAHFVEGRTYLVFARTLDYSGIGVARPARSREAVYASKCGPTTVVGGESRRIAALLGEPLPPVSAGRAMLDAFATQLLALGGLEAYSNPRSDERIIFVSTLGFGLSVLLLAGLGAAIAAGELHAVDGHTL